MNDTMTSAGPATTPPDIDPHHDGLEDPLPPIRPRVRLGPLTVVLFVALMTALGAFAGARWQKADSPAPTAGITFAGRANRTGAGGTGGGAPASVAGATGSTGSSGSSGSTGSTGKVTVVDGAKVYVTDAAGATTIITTDGKTVVAAAAPSSLSALKAGDTVTVQGTANPDGSTSASSITISPGPAPGAASS